MFDESAWNAALNGSTGHEQRPGFPIFIEKEAADKQAETSATQEDSLPFAHILCLHTAQLPSPAGT